MRCLPSGTTLVLLSSLAWAGLTPAQTAPIAAGELHTCAIVSNGRVKCWGYNDFGQLGDGTRDSRVTPVRVKRLSGVTAIAAGGNHTCALISNGGVKCWGSNRSGQLGIGASDFAKELPQGVKRLSGVTAIAAGGLHTCAVTSAGGVKCWGSNAFLQLGDGTRDNRYIPVRVQNLGDFIVTAVTAGTHHSCARAAGGDVKCWGRNQFGQLGDDSDRERVEPVQVKRLGLGASAIAAGFDHNCALIVSGRVKCWGRNQSGQLGDETFIAQWKAVRVTTLPDATAIVAGYGHTCARILSGHLMCWGFNALGQLGDGSASTRPKPDFVTRVSEVPALAAETASPVR